MSVQFFCSITRNQGEMGIVGKTFLEEVNNKLSKHLCYDQWCSTSTKIEWFRAIENKKTLQIH